MNTVVHNPKTWGITLKEYNTTLFGTAINGFKVPNSIITRFRKPLWRNKKDTSIIVDSEPNTPDEWTIENVFDVEKAFEELAFTVVSAIVSSYEVLRLINFDELEGQMVLDKDYKVIDRPVEGSTQDWMRRAVFNAMEFLSVNNQFWERINGATVSLGSGSASITPTEWNVATDMLGQKAQMCLTNSGINDYELLYPWELSQTTQNQNIRLIKKINIKDNPNII